MFRKLPNVFLLLALFSYLLRWIGIRFMGNENILQATPLHLSLLMVLLLIAIRKEQKTLLWMAAVFFGCFATAWLAGFSMSFPEIDFPVIMALYGALFLTGICSVISLSQIPAWQKTGSAVLLSLILGWLLSPIAMHLGYWQETKTLSPLMLWLCLASVSMVAAAAWFALRLRASHFAIALFLMEVVFLALLRL